MARKLQTGRIFLIDGHRVMMPGFQQAIFMALWNARGRGLTWQQIAEIAYGRSPQPLGPGGVVRSIIYRLRLALAPTGFRIVLDYGRQYRMVRRVAEQQVGHQRAA